jgi:predicted anti-sigma-YlaC factor YlaD
LATDCARAREAVSVQLDGELPELELDRLETHLRICPACSAWANGVRGVTQRLRDATLEVPAADGFVLPQRSHRWTAVSASVALASAAAVVATMFVAPGRQIASLGPPLGSARSGATYDVAAGVAYPSRPMVGSMTLAVSVPALDAGPVHPL